MADLTLKYTFQVVEKALNEWWDITILEYTSEYEEEYYLYVFEELERLKISINYRLNANGDDIEKV